MWEDPIIAEIHRAREKLAAECNYDIRAFFASLRTRQLLQKKQVEPNAEDGRRSSSGTSESPSPGAAPAAQR